MVLHDDQDVMTKMTKINLLCLQPNSTLVLAFIFVYMKPTANGARAGFKRETYKSNKHGISSPNNPVAISLSFCYPLSPLPSPLNSSILLK